METASKKTKNSRWSRAPKPSAYKLKEAPTLLGILKLLHRYRYLQSNDIHAWVGGYQPHVRKLLDDMYDEPNCLVNRPAQQRANANANYTPMTYELDTAGATILRTHGFPKWTKVAHTNFEHELMLNRIMFSIELGMRGSDAEFISWSDILASKLMPQATLDPEKTPHPTQLPYTLIVKKKGKDEQVHGHIEADGKPFGIRYSDARFFFAPGIEADCATEPLAPEDYTRSSIKRKFLAYIHIIENETYRKRWGIPTLYVPFFFPTISRMESAMELLNELTQHKPSLRKYFLFYVFPTLTTYGGQAPATGHVFTEPHHRVELKPFNLSEGR